MANTMKSPVIVFDFGAVLVDWSPYYLYRKIMKDDEEIKAFLEEIDFASWNPRFDAGYPFEQGVEEKCAEFPHHSDLIRRFNSHWLDAMGEIMTGTVAIAERLKAAGYKLYGLSNWSVTKFELVKDRFDFLKLLDDYLLSAQAGLAKPDPGIFKIFLDKIQHKAGDCLFIDDSLGNIKTAEALGFQTIHFRSADQLENDLIGMRLKF